MNDKLKAQIKADASTVYHVLKILLLIVGATVGVMTFFTPRTAHDALASEQDKLRYDTAVEFKNIRADNEKTIDLLCILSVELIGKDAVTQYCTRRNQ